MNSIRKTIQLNDQELAEGTSISASWHNDYNDTAYIYIGGLETKLTEMDIATVFSQFGNPTHVKLSRDPKTGKSRGFAWLKYADQRSTVLAVDNFNGVELLGRTVRVDHTYYESRDEEADQKEVDMLAKARDMKVKGPEKEEEKRESRDSRRSHDSHRSRDDDRSFRRSRNPRDRSPDRDRRSHRSSRRDDEKSSSRRSRDDDRDERKSRDSDRGGEKSRDSERRKDEDRDEKRDEGSRRSRDGDRSSRRSRDGDSGRSRDDRSSRRSRRDRDDSRERSHRSKRSRRDRSRDDESRKSRDEKPRDTGKPIVKPAAPQDPDLVDPMAAYFAGKE